MQPILFRPLLKQIRWGGRRLGTVLGKPIGEAGDYAESWEIVDHGSDQSVVADGPFQGWTLSRLLAEQGRELLGRNASLKQFPLLIKFLDAHDRLSVQVHPNDRLARRYDPNENGKTEAWVILDALPNSQLYAGLKAGVDRAVFEQSLANGTVEECLHAFSVSGGDCVFIPAGTVHAIGEGILLAEVQQSSDLTFRLHDWGRVGPDGKPRALHIERALASIDFNRGPVDPVTPRVVSNDPHPVEELVRSDYFVMHRHQTSQSFRLSPKNRFHIIMLLAGEAELSSEDDRRHIKMGHTILIPASCADVLIEPAGEISLLEVFLP